jgi:hypothetical protein
VGAVQVFSGGFSYYGTGTALSPNWVLTAGHNLDFDDNGVPDAGLSINFHLPGFGSYAASAFYTHPDFSGFGNPSIQRDLGLLYFATPLPMDLLFPGLQGELAIGDQVTLAGFGRSGYGDYGYTTAASVTTRRIGFNVVDSFEADDLGGHYPALFRYDFDAPDTTGLPGGSLGNDLETIIGPGDSGGPLLLDNGNGYSLVGVNTFIQGYGGRFGDIGGGIVLSPYLDWITQTTGLAVPEPATLVLVWWGAVYLIARCASRRRSADFQVGLWLSPSCAVRTQHRERTCPVIRPSKSRQHVGAPGRENHAGISSTTFLDINPA